MNIRDISKPVTAAALNESLASRFGQRIKLEDYTLEQLQDARNKVRTKLSQVETTESFNSVQSDAYQKSKLFVDVLNAEISERENIEEKSVSQAQQKAAGAALAAKRGDIPKSELEDASKEMMKMSTKDLEKFAGTKHKGLPDKKNESVVTEGTAETKAKMKQIVSAFKPLTKGEKVVKAFSYKPGKEFASVPVIITENPKADEMYGPFASYIYSQKFGEMLHSYYHPDMEDAVSHAKTEIKDDAEQGNLDPAAGQQRLPFEAEFDRVPPEDHNDLDYEGGMAMKQLSTINDAADELADCLKTDENLPEWVQKKIILAMSYIDTARDYMKSAKDVDQERSLGLESVIREGAEESAELVMAAKDMVDRITGWMEDTAEMQTESMLELADSIRDEMGSEQSEQFVGSVKPSLESLYTALESTRASLTAGVGILTGTEEPAEPMGDEEMGDPEMEPTVDAEVDATEPADDEFAAAEPAAGGEEEADRPQRESIERSRHLGKILSKKK